MRKAATRCVAPPALADELFTVSEVAAILKLSDQTIRNWI
jgi:Helix-turn-helix domain